MLLQQEVLGGVQEDSDRVWEEVVMGGGGGGRSGLVQGMHAYQCPFGETVDDSGGSTGWQFRRRVHFLRAEDRVNTLF
jgi:hypothetical protein